MKIGFIGLGNVGGKLAGSLFRNEIDLTVHDLDKSVTDNFKSKGVKVANSVGELVREVDVVITCLPSPKISICCNVRFGCKIFVSIVAYGIEVSHCNENVLKVVFCATIWIKITLI